MTSVKDFTKRVFGTSKIMTAVAVVLIVACVGMGMIAVAGWATKQQKEAAVEQLKQNSSSGTSTPGSSTGGSSSQSTTNKVYTAAQVAQHGSATDCWMIIGSEVYDLTSFLDQHPGGAYAMIPYCGKDGTQGFATMDRGRGQTHSASANQLKEDYKIGTATR